MRNESNRVYPRICVNRFAEITCDESEMVVDDGNRGAGVAVIALDRDTRARDASECKMF